VKLDAVKTAGEESQSLIGEIHVDSLIGLMYGQQD